jgi:hypothetical protein
MQMHTLYAELQETAYQAEKRPPGVKKQLAEIKKSEFDQ